MAEEDSNIIVSPQQLVALQKRMALNKTLLIAVLAISGIVFTVMATGLTVMYMRIAAIKAPNMGGADNQLQQQLTTIDQQILSLDDFRNNELKKINTFTRQLELVASDCSVEKKTAYQQLLISREKDFQALLETVKTGASNLAAMNKGSRQWLLSHNTALDGLKKNSTERTTIIQGL